MASNDYEPFGGDAAHARGGSLEAQASFAANPSSLEMYKRCFKCGAPAANFLQAAPGDAPLGCTLQLVIAPDVPHHVD